MDYKIKAIIGFVLFMLLLLGMGFISKNIMNSNRSTFKKSKYLQSIDKLYLSNDKWIEIIELGDQIMVLGVTQGGINVLKEIRQEELKNVQPDKEKSYFLSMLEKQIRKKA